jgi:hypothetical protein
MNTKKDKTFADYILETYQKTGLSRRRFFRRIGLQITGVGALLATLARPAKGCPCTGCNSACNTGCNATCDINICEENDVCLSANVCTYNTCLSVNTCQGRNMCDYNRCETGNVCTSDTCELDICPGTNDVCGTNTCYTANPCGTNICQEDDLCIVSNICNPTDIDCGYLDISCPLGNCISPNEPI